MPDTYKFKGADGAERTFVGDRPPTPDEMTSIEKGEAPKAEPHMSASAPGSAMPEGSDMPGYGLAGPKTHALMNTPLAHPTGIDAIDNFLSPANLILTGSMGAESAAKAVSGAVASLSDRVGTAATAKILKFITPSMLKKPAELADLILELGKSVKPEVPAAPPAPAQAVAAPAPPSAPVGAPPPPPTSPMAAAPVAPPAPAGPAVAAPEAVPAPEARVTPPFYEQKALNELAIMARRAKITLSPSDYQAGLRLMKEGGVSADTAIGALTQQRIAPAAAAEVPKLTAAEMVQAQKWKAAGATDDQIMQRVQLSRALTSATGTPTPEEAAAAMRTLKATKYKQ